MSMSSLPRRAFSILLVITSAILPSLLGGCGLGATTVPIDRVGYGEAIATSGREELLRNIVRLRYLESPVFLGVNSMTNSYSFDASMNTSAGWNFGLAHTTSNSLGASSGFSNRPTITYSPIGGDRFARAYLRPIPAPSVMALVQSGYRVDFLLPLLVESINYHRNGSRVPGRVEVPTDGEFEEIVELMADMQVRGEFYFRFESSDDGGSTGHYLEFDPDPTAESQARVDRLCSLLDVPAGSPRIRIETGVGSREGDVASMSPRSLLMMIANLSGGVEVPQRDLDRGITAPCARDPLLPGPRLTVRSGRERPTDTYVSIERNGDWFWIESNDLASKEVFLTLMILTNLTDTSGSGDTPVLTIPAG